METVLALNNITKSYPGVVALNNVSLEFAKGEVHALLGENGAGKSTLIKVISGAIAPDSGEIRIDGQSYARMEPHKAKTHGIEAIYQEFNLVESLTVAENICFGERIGTFVNFEAMRKKAQDVFAMMDIAIDPKELVRKLPTAQQQLVEIAKSISRNAKVLIMDEPSAPLSVAEVEKLFKIIHRLRAEGTTIIYISHRLDELFEISDRVSVLRDGQFIQTINTADTTQAELIALMVGRELTESYPQRATAPGEVALEVRNVSGNGDEGISLTVHKGEILGLAGLVGAGRTELARLIFGADKLDSGEILVNGNPVKLRTPHDAIKNGIGLIPEDRKLQGCFLEKSIKWNISINSLKSLLKGPVVVDTKKEDATAKEYRDKFDIKTPSLNQLAKNLSGGNQQKVVLAKTLAANSDIIIFDEPTRGIDVGAKQEIYHMMNDLVAQGKAILMVTSEMSELLGMSDRIAVLYGGKLAGVLQRDEFSQSRVLELASGLE